VTLTRLLAAWVAVAAWFVGVALGIGRLRAPGQAPRRVLGRRAIEAAVVTLFGSLWFDSLGSGEWWLVFLLVGVLVALAAAPAGGSGEAAARRPWLADGVVDVLRYVIAGALLAWRLG
jgi:hypothetical protein